VAIPRRHLGDDPRVTFALADGARYLAQLVAERKRFDLVFADTWPGKYTQLDDVLHLVRPGGLYVVDDMLPQPSWPADHAPKVATLIETLTSRPDLHVTVLDWSTGVIVAAKVR
jgi:predicted O-methyltransferase YrrM